MSTTLGSAGIKSFLLFMLTTALATALAISVAVLVQPGQGFDMTLIDQSSFITPPAPAFTQILIDLIPSNPIAAYVESNMLQIIFFTVLFSICLLMIGERGKPIISFTEKLNDVMMQVVNVAMQITLRTVKKRLGIDNSTASFVVPFGATINMDGTAKTHGVATIFIANVYNIDLSITDYLVVIGMILLASIGTAGVPGLGLSMLAMVFNQVGLPIEAIALILGVDRLLDMMRTTVNVTGDAVVATIVARSEGSISLEIFNDPDAGKAEDIHLPHK